MASKIIRVVTRAADGTLRNKEFNDFEQLSSLHEQLGVDDCSTDLSLRGMPIFRGLVGPMPESRTVVRYESPDVFEFQTKEWTKQKVRRRRRRSTETPETPAKVPTPNFAFGASTVSTPVSV